MKITLDNGAFAPERAHATDAGADLRTPYDFTLKAHSKENIDTGVHIQLPPNTVGMIKSKSGLHMKKHIKSEGVIDEGYTGSIIVGLANYSDQDYEFKRGDKITQLVVIPVDYVTFEEVESLDESDRGDAGFGSTGN